MPSRRLGSLRGAHRLPLVARAVAVVLAATTLGACGSDAPTVTVTPPPVVTPPIDTTPTVTDPAQRLLTDAELVTPVDPNAPPQSADRVDFAKVATVPIRSLTSTNFADLRFLAPLLQGKRIVQLGESGHGVAEFNRAKVRLIKYMHEELGYDVIAFESSLFGCYAANERADSLDARTLMRSCIFGVWHTQEVEPLFEYVKQTRRTARPLTLAGVDVQQSSFLSDSRRPAFLRAVVGAVDTAYARRVFTLDSGVNVGVGGAAFRTYADTSFARVTAAFDTLAAFLNANRAALEARMGVESTTVARVAVRGVRPYLASLRTTDQTVSRDARDLGMANNVDALLDEMYPGKKMMVWAHNSHIRHAGMSVAPTTSPLKWDDMGAHVARRRRAELYSIGLFMYRGRAANNGRDVYSISRPAQERESMEAILYHARRQYLFLDFTLQSRNEGSRWLFEPIGAFDWGTNLERMILRDQYDGILYIHTVNPPIYIL